MNEQKTRQQLYEAMEYRKHTFMNADDIDPDDCDSSSYSATAYDGHKISPFILFHHGSLSQIGLPDIIVGKNFDEMVDKLLADYNFRQDLPEDTEADTQKMVNELLQKSVSLLVEYGYIDLKGAQVCVSGHGNGFTQTVDRQLVQTGDRLKSSVFIDVKGSPDIMITTTASQVNSTRQSRPRSIFLEKRGVKDSFVFGPFGEAKPSLKLNDITKNKSIRDVSKIKQTAVYGIMFMMLTLPCLPRNVAAEIFGPDYKIFVPLLSHKQMYVLEMDSTLIPRTGIIQCYVSEQLSGEKYVKTMLRWVYWAVLVAQKLDLNKKYLISGKRTSCWVPLSAYENAIRQFAPPAVVKTLDFSSFQPFPSFYNPIFRNDDYYLRIVDCYWTGSFNSSFKILYYCCPALFINWFVKNNFLVIPRYGSSLQDKPPKDMATLKNVLICLLTVLEKIADSGFIHGDLRLANICWTKNEKGITLTNDIITVIDYDLCSEIGHQPVQYELSFVIAPDKYGTSKSDLWSVGILILKFILGTNSLNIIENLKRTLKENELNCIQFSQDIMIVEFRKYKEQLQQVLNQCLQPESLRGTIEKVKIQIENWSVD